MKNGVTFALLELEGNMGNFGFSTLRILDDGPGKPRRIGDLTILPIFVNGVFTPFWGAKAIRLLYKAVKNPGTPGNPSAEKMRLHKWVYLTD